MADRQITITEEAANALPICGCGHNIATHLFIMGARATKAKNCRACTMAYPDRMIHCAGYEPDNLEWLLQNR